MLKQLTHTQVWVHDQDEALAFYTEKLGMELREDVTVPELGNFRWLSVGVPGRSSPVCDTTGAATSSTSRMSSRAPSPQPGWTGTGGPTAP